MESKLGERGLNPSLSLGRSCPYPEEKALSLANSARCSVRTKVSPKLGVGWGEGEALAVLGEEEKVPAVI